MAMRMNVLLTFVRGYRNYTKAWLKDAVRYEKVKYHPRVENFEDPPIEPSKVFMVERVKPFKGNPYWEKDILKRLGFVEKESEPVFVKNIPEMCAMLWKVKHLVKIYPVQLPKGLENVDDFTEVYVQDGKVYLTGKLDPVRYDATITFKNDPKKMGGDTIAEKLRLLWLKGLLI